MTTFTANVETHEHNFLGTSHTTNERKAWGVIALCSAMMVIEIGGGILFKSLALVADGLHMSTHAIALLIAALAYTFARKHSADPRFSFGTGKLGDLAGFSSAIVLALIALFIGYEAITRFLDPVTIKFREAIPIAFLGLLVNVASAWLLSGDHDHHHGRAHEDGHTGSGNDDESLLVVTRFGTATLEIAEADGPPGFRLTLQEIPNDADALRASIQTVRPDGSRQAFSLLRRDAYFESADVIPEPHEFSVELTIALGDESETHSMAFEEHHDHGSHHANRDHNLRAAFVHVAGDAAVSVLAILGLLAGRYLGWVWMDPVMGVIGAIVIAVWAYGLIRDTGKILLDMTPDTALAARIRKRVEAYGDRVTDLHLWRLGPGHLGAIVSIATDRSRDVRYYRSALASIPSLSHLTIEVVPVTPHMESANVVGALATEAS